MPILHSNNPNGGRESTTVTATISSHDVYTKLYAEETKEASQIEYGLDASKEVSTGSNSSGIFTIYCLYVLATYFELSC
jgi:hypothetical protein